MKLSRFLTVTVLVLMLTAVMVTVAPAQPRSFTGNAPADFTGPDVVVLTDPHGIDVSVASPPFARGSISGWDVAAIYFDYESSADVMYIGIDCYGICGDADGDGDPGRTSSIHAASGGTDPADLEGTESFALLIDTNNDGVFEVVVGVTASWSTPPPADISTFGTYNFTGSPYAPQFGFGTPLPNTTALYANPNAGAPDLEFTIADFSTLPGFSFTRGQTFEFQVKLFAGSFQDAGIGEDYVLGTAQFSDARITLDPLSDTNAVNEQHQITATVQQNDGTGWINAPDGTLVTFSLLNNSAGADFVGANTCTTSGGTCSVTINTSTPGSVDIHATTTFVVGGQTLTRETDGTGDNSGDAHKDYVDAWIKLSPLQDTNAVNEQHEITATVEQNDGSGWGAAPDRTLVTFSLLNNTAGAFFFAGGNSCTTSGGTCSVSINTSTPGSVDIHATTTFVVGGQTLTRETDGTGDNSGDAHKDYVDAWIKLSPLQDTNAVNEQHQITATVEQNDGSAWGAAPYSTRVDFSLTGNASFVGNGFCFTTGGSCSVSINTSTPGSVDIHAKTDVSVGGLILHRETDGTGGNSGDAHKDYVVCALVVTKTCLVVPTPPGPFVCKDAKPINELTMIWDGTQTIRVRAWKGSVGSTLLADIDDIKPGDEDTVSGYAGSPNDVIWEIFNAVTGLKIGESTFHLSCSDEDMNGPEDCGKRQGDGKGKSGYINQWRFERMAGNGLTLDCTPTPAEPSDACAIVPLPARSCETLGKPNSLTFKYTGGSCDASDNDQGDKAKCSGDPGGAEPVKVVVTKDADKITVTPSDQSISVGDEVRIERNDGKELGREIKLEIRQGSTVLQSLTIHTSCSQPLEVGDVFGSMELVAFNGQEAPGNEVTYTYVVTNSGSALTGVRLVDTPLGAIAGPFDLGAGETLTFTEVAEILATTTNKVTVTGYLANGDECSASDMATVTVSEP